MKWTLMVMMITFASGMHAQPLKDTLDKILNNQQIETGTSYSLAIIKKGKTIYQNSIGTHKITNRIKSTAKSNYRMASVSKQFTAAAIYLLAKQKKIQVHQNLSSFFPEFSAVGLNITVSHLLSHTSGIMDYEELVDDTDTTQLSDRDVLNMVKNVGTTYFQPGSKFRYSNTAYCILSLIVEKASGMSFHDFCNRYMFKPLGMKNTVWYGQRIPHRVYGYAKDKSGHVVFRDQSVTSATLGDGGLYTSIEDYKKWYLNRKKILGISFKEMIMSSSAKIKDDYFYSYGWFYENDDHDTPKTILHSGSTCGFSNIVIEIPANELLIIYFTNLADHHDSFLPIERALKSFGILDEDFSYRRVHDETH